MNCAHCNSEVTESASFCSACGHSLQPGAPPQAPDDSRLAALVRPSLDAVADGGQWLAWVLLLGALGVASWQAAEFADPGRRTIPLGFWNAWAELGGYGLLLLGVAWVADAARGNTVRGTWLLPLGALTVLFSSIAAGIWQAVFIGDADAGFATMHAWAFVGQGAGIAALLILVAQAINYFSGDRLWAVGAMKLVGVLVLATGVGVGTWSTRLDPTLGLGLPLPLTGFSVANFTSFWVQFSVFALMGLLILGLAILLEGLDRRRAVGPTVEPTSEAP